MMNSIVALFFLIFVADPCQALARPWPWKARAPGSIEVYRIKAPHWAICHAIDDLEMTLDDPHLYEYNPHCKHDGSVYYLATWQGNQTIVGMTEVTPGWTFHFEDSSVDRLPLVQGLYLDDMTTARKYLRMGVATAMMTAIERDATDLYNQMELANPKHSFERLPCGRIDLHVHSIWSKEALGFYRSAGFQFDPRENKGDGKMTKRGVWKLMPGLLFRRLLDRYGGIFLLVKRVAPHVSISTDSEAGNNTIVLS